MFGRHRNKKKQTVNGTKNEKERLLAETINRAKKLQKRGETFKRVPVPIRRKDKTEKEEDPRELTPVELSELEKPKSPRSKVENHPLSTANFLKEIANCQDGPGWAWYKVGPLDTENHDGFRQEVQFHIAIVPTQENLHKAAHALLPILGEKHKLDFKCLIFPRDEDFIIWDMAEINGLDKHLQYHAGESHQEISICYDGDPRGTEVYVFADDDPFDRTSQRSASEWKEVLLDCWKALQDAGIYFAYVPAPNGCREIFVEDGYCVSPFFFPLPSLQSTARRHGMLSKRPSYFPATTHLFEEVNISYQDLEQKGIKVVALETMQKERLNYMEEHISTTRKRIVAELKAFHEKINEEIECSKLRPHINELLDELRCMIEKRSNKAGKLISVNDITQIIYELQERFPRQANSNLEHHATLQGLINFCNERAEEASLEKFIEFLNLSSAKIVSLMSEKIIGKSEREKQDRLYKKAQHASVRPDLYHTSFLPHITILADFANNEMRELKCEFQQMQDYIIRLFITEGSYTKNRSDEDGEKEIGESPDLIDIDFSFMIDQFPSLMQLYYRLIILLYYEEEKYRLEEARIQNKENRENLMCLMENTRHRDDKSFLNSFQGVPLKIKFDVFNMLNRKNQQGKIIDLTIKRKIELLENLIEDEWAVVELRIKLLDVVERLNVNLNVYLHECDRLLSGPAPTGICGFFSARGRYALAAQSNLASDLHLKLAPLQEQIVSELENPNLDTFMGRYEEFRILLENAIADNSSCCGFVFVLKTEVDFTQVLSFSKRKLDWIDGKICMEDVDDQEDAKLESNKISLYRARGK